MAHMAQDPSKPQSLVPRRLGPKPPSLSRAYVVHQPSLQEHIELAARQAQQLKRHLTQALLKEHFSKASKTNLLKTYQQVQTQPQCPHGLMALYLVLMVSAHERKLLAQAQDEPTNSALSAPTLTVAPPAPPPSTATAEAKPPKLSLRRAGAKPQPQPADAALAPAALKLPGNAFARAAVDPELIDHCLKLEPLTLKSALRWHLTQGRRAELADDLAQALWYYRQAQAATSEAIPPEATEVNPPAPSTAAANAATASMAEASAADALEARLRAELEASLHRITAQLSATATHQRTARQQELLSRVQDLTRRFARYPVGIAVPLVEAHQTLVQELLTWYAPHLKWAPAPFPAKNWGLKGTLNPSIKGPEPQGYWLNERGAIELQVQGATILDQIHLAQLTRYALYQQHALFELSVEPAPPSALTLSALSAWLKSQAPTERAPRLDCYINSEWSSYCGLIELMHTLPPTLLNAYATSMGSSSDECAQLLSAPYRELMSAAQLGLNLSCVRLNAHDFALPPSAPRLTPDGTKVAASHYGRTNFYRWVAAFDHKLSSGSSPCAQLLGYSMGLSCHYLDLLVYEHTAYTQLLTQLSAAPHQLSLWQQYELLRAPELMSDAQLIERAVQHGTLTVPSALTPAAQPAVQPATQPEAQPAAAPAALSPAPTVAPCKKRLSLHRPKTS